MVMLPMGAVLIASKVVEIPMVALQVATGVVTIGAIIFVIDSIVATYLERHTSRRSDD